MDGEGTGVLRELLLEPKHSLGLFIKTAPAPPFPPRYICSFAKAHIYADL